MALGVEHHWAQAFAGIVQNPPNWYVSPNGFRLQSHLLLQFHAQHGVRYAPGVRLGAAVQFLWIRLWRRRRRAASPAAALGAAAAGRFDAQKSLP